jgi:sugar/nucleoside kinase (ribokinase family)/sugar phosphate isomerase/epimerase
VDVPGGKGCTQAVAAAKLSLGTVAFCGQFGNDAAADILLKALEDEDVDVSHCGQHDDLPSGRGWVFITDSGSVSAVVSGGSNTGGWKSWQEMHQNGLVSDEIDDLLENAKCIMLQREVPEYVNLLIASEAKKRKNIVVFQDVGGEDRPISRHMLKLCDYLVPNESELKRLVMSLGETTEDGGKEEGEIVHCAKILQRHGARNVLVTCGSRGSTLVTEAGHVLHQPASALASSNVVDETGAGDCYRAAFVVALLEGRTLHECMAFASAAGACSVTKTGAVPSTPSREEVEAHMKHVTANPDKVLNIPRGGKDHGYNNFPFMFGSRLNSMKDRPELWQEPLQNPHDYVKRQAMIQGLGCVDFNYPQHFHTWSVQEAKEALDEAGLKAGAVCLRYPSKFARGAMNHPDEAFRREAIELTKEAAVVAKELGCDEVVVWSAYDGYDYPFQVDYDEKWSQLVRAFRECCDAHPEVKFSLEYKPTDENTRFFTVPSTGAALLLVKEIDRPNMGLTLDVGHMLMSGENPAQSISMVGKRLFGIQLNDGYTRLAAEDGMMFGSIHPSMALEIIYQLRRIGFSGHFYFDTFPQRTDPVLEAEYNIARVKAFWRAVEMMDESKANQAMKEHDAISALNLVNEALRNT